MLFRLAVNAFISQIGKFGVQRFPTCCAASTGFDYAVHADCVKRLVHGVAEASAWPIVMRAYAADLRRHMAAVRFRCRVAAHVQLKVLARHVTVTVIVCEHSSYALMVMSQKFTVGLSGSPLSDSQTHEYGNLTEYTVPCGSPLQSMNPHEP